MTKGQKIYKFAVYGRAASGKTCILAALAMKCIAHPGRYTSTWILEPVGLPRPEGEPEEWDSSKPASAFHLGKEWLLKAIDRLSKGELPPPNPHRAEPLRYLYHFTTPAHRTFQVELIDYSGELIDPAISNDEMAKRLREHIHAMDGILVLAEVPRPKRDSEPLSADLLKLEQAFALLKAEREDGPTLDIPLALLINKWDRRSPLRYTTPENEYEELLKFLDSKPEPPHRALVDKLRNSVAPDNFRVFPVSAFGESELVSTEDQCVVERPKHVTPLRAFGLEDGFIWAAKRRDEIDLHALEKNAAKVTCWCPCKSLFMLPLWAQFKKGRRLTGRFAENSQEKTRARHALYRFFLFMSMHTVFAAITLFLLFMGTETLYDNFRYRSVLESKADPQAHTRQLQTDEQWLEAYYRSPLYRHILSRFFVVKKDAALEHLKNFRNRREEMLWMPVGESTDSLVRVALAKRYLAQFGENGKYRDLANSIVTKAELSKQYFENELHLTNIATLLESMLALGEQTDGSLAELQENLEQMPYPQSLTEKLYLTKRGLLDSITTQQLKIAKFHGKARGEAFEEEYYNLMRNNDIHRALDHLAGWRPGGGDTDRLAELKKDFKKRGMVILEKQVREKINNRLWRQARDIINKNKDDKRIVAYFSAGQLKRLRQLAGNVDAAEDKNLYEQVVRYKDQDHVVRYLKQAPLLKMKRAVSRYQLHLNRLANPLSLTLQLTNIYWGGSCKDNDILVTMNGKNIIEKTNLESKKHGRSSQIGSTRFRAKLSDNAKIYVKVVCSGWLGIKKTGEVTWEGSVAKLAGARLGLNNDKNKKNYVEFTLAGLPEEPALPSWGK